QRPVFSSANDKENGKAFRSCFVKKISAVSRQNFIGRIGQVSCVGEFGHEIGFKRKSVALGARL
ncbi:MAG TPA: hypothetical protein PK467_20165, partial [Candidatus Wallbacteria bacterium]|nr:hypothetical protein [Candidatus Wallbacteria bacterium]